MTKSVAIPQASELAADTDVFLRYLDNMNLPMDNVIASTEERNVLAANLPQFVNSLPPELRRDARYLSKFVGATAIGLFDAALNYVWNEVVLNLRKKASIYGVDLFFDAAVGGQARQAFKTEDDLAGIKDSVLLVTCRKLELISDVVYRKIDHILTMRNEVAASHPNVEAIGGFELLGWLQTCVRDVLQDALSPSAIRIKSFVSNLKSTNSPIDVPTQKRLKEELRLLATPHVNNLTISLFGMYVDQNSDQVLRKNISFIAKDVWDCSSESVKTNIGAKIEGYRTNLQNGKLEKGVEFLTGVDGLRYESLSTKIINLISYADQLLSAHYGYNNFYNEPQHITEILRYCKKAEDIPVEVKDKLIKTVVKCRIGRGLSYCEGVSPSGRDMYDQFIKLQDDDGIVRLIISLFDPEINSKLTNGICQEHLISILEMCKNVAVSERLEEILNYLLNDIPNAHKAANKGDFRELCKPLIHWK